LLAVAVNRWNVDQDTIAAGVVTGEVARFASGDTVDVAATT